MTNKELLKSENKVVVELVLLDFLSKIFMERMINPGANCIEFIGKHLEFENEVITREERKYECHY